MKIKRRVGPPHKPTLQKRERLSQFRIPLWMIKKLQEHPRQGGRMIEAALLEKYNWKG